ncbi:ferric-chelate reductase 1 isoform X1 [Brachionus plicatilis]|uniref:ascorbate ferrireductase (transmembrane) n=1 Tax=Brachionus plicatilis TaxID=10195 RepID=A0A3M7RXX8_BRAPC|nr:ferric-chelate reductase 1 isoform X1 [Brachionus plicatilis]
MDNAEKNKDKVIAHACLMVFVWLYLVPNGIVIARYYKNLLPSSRFLNAPFWFNAHRLVMIISLLFIIPAFILILAQENWHWVSPDNRTKYAHSILGIVTIGLLFFQIVLGVAIPGKDSSFRNLFGWFHRFSGIFILVLSVTVCYFGVLIDGLNLDNIGWGLILGHNLWMVLFVVIFEINHFKYSKKMYVKANTQENDQQNKMCGPTELTLIIHLVGSLAFVVALITMISIRL